MAGKYPRLKGRNTPIWHPPSFSSVVFSFNTLTLRGFTLNWRSLPVKRIWVAIPVSLGCQSVQSSHVAPVPLHGGSRYWSRLGRCSRWGGGIQRGRILGYSCCCCQVGLGMRWKCTAAYHCSSSTTAAAGIFWEIVVELVEGGAVHRPVERWCAASQAAQFRVPG